MRRAQYRRRGIYLLPALLTVGNLFCGYSSLIQSAAGRFEIAATLIIVAAVLDGLDGRIARMTDSTSEFGLQFDSLADIVSFGVAPSLLIHRWALSTTGRVGWLLVFLFVVCAAMRLARYNTQSAPTLDRRSFVGLPSPVGGSALACFVLAFPRSGGTEWAPLVVAPVVFAIAVLMISKLRYRSFRELDLSRRSYIYILPLAAILVAVAMYPRGVPFLLCTAYLLSAPTLYLWGLVTRRRDDAQATTAPGTAAGASEVADEPALR